MKANLILVPFLTATFLSCATMPSYYENETESVEIILNSEKNIHKRKGYLDYYFNKEGILNAKGTESWKVPMSRHTYKFGNKRR